MEKRVILYLLDVVLTTRIVGKNNIEDSPILLIKNFRTTMGEDVMTYNNCDFDKTVTQ